MIQNKEDVDMEKELFFVAQINIRSDELNDNLIVPTVWQIGFYERFEDAETAVSEITNGCLKYAIIEKMNSNFVVSFRQLFVLNENGKYVECNNNDIDINLDCRNSLIVQPVEHGKFSRCESCVYCQKCEHEKPENKMIYCKSLNQSINRYSYRQYICTNFKLNI